jgi:diguanylate cyclase (GGDEF)-like protein/PAS domain S-box-containing protein
MPDNSKELLRVFIDQAPVAIAMFDREMRYIAASRRWISDYGLDAKNLRGRCHYEVFPEIPDRWRLIHQRALMGEVLTSIEDRFDRADGAVQWLRWEVHPWTAQEIVQGITIFAEDITERMRNQERILQLNAELEHRVRDRTAQLEHSIMDLRKALLDADGLRRELREQAIRDPLTGLFNRRFLEETLNHEIARSRRAHCPLGVVMFDVDNFKQLNDRFGHATGDWVLRWVGNLLASKIRSQDVACRLGGDEFVVILPETSLAGASQKANHLLKRLRSLKSPDLELQLPQVEFSMGVSAFPTHGATGAELLRSADTALYRAKEQGGGRVIAAA